MIVSPRLSKCCHDLKKKKVASRFRAVLVVSLASLSISDALVQYLLQANRRRKITKYFNSIN